MTGSIPVLIVDDHPLVRAGIRALLETEPDIEVVAEAGSATEALDAYRQHRPRVVLMDLRMPGGGVAATQALRREDPAARVVVLTTYTEDEDILRAIEAGAVGYLIKSIDRADLVAAVRSADRGEAVMGPDAVAALARHARQPSPRVALSERERAVLTRVASGLTNAEIGRQLFIEEATVKTYLLRIFDKLDVRDRTAAVTVALRRGMLSLPDGRDDRNR